MIKSIMPICLFLISINANAATRQYNLNSWGICGEDSDTVTYEATWSTQDPHLPICGGTTSVDPILNTCSKMINGLFSEVVSNIFCVSNIPPANTIFYSPAGTMTTSLANGNGSQDQTCAEGESSGSIIVTCLVGSPPSCSAPPISILSYYGEYSVNGDMTGVGAIENGSSSSGSGVSASGVGASASGLGSPSSGGGTSAIGEGNSFIDISSNINFWGSISNSLSQIYLSFLSPNQDLIPKTFLLTSERSFKFNLEKSTVSSLSSISTMFSAAGVESTTQSPLLSIYKISKVSNIRPNSFDFPQYLTEYNNHLYFSARNSSGYEKLFKVNSSGLITQVSNIFSEDGDYPTYLTVFNNELYFNALSPSGFYKLFKLNSSDNIIQVSNINPDSHDLPEHLVIFNDALYFSGQNSLGQLKLYKLNSQGSITQVSNINSENNDFPKNLTVYNNQLYFSARIFTLTNSY